MKSALDHWISRHDLGGIELKHVQYRPGAVQTAPFGLSAGYKIIDGKAVWGYARIHTGCDRANARSGDIVVSPLPHEETHLIDYNGEGYGSLIRIVSHVYSYELRIAHMDPEIDIEPEVRDLLEAHQPVPMGVRMGWAGCYGIGTGRHTHTELVAWGDGVEMFDDLAVRLHGPAALTHETEAEVLAEYRRLGNWKQATDRVRLDDYVALRQYRGITWSNRFRHHYRDPLLDREAWRYSTWLLMGL